MPRSIIILLIAITVLLGGCATQQERVDRIRVQYPQLDQEAARNLAEGRILVGMTEDMVRFAKGSPTFTRMENGKVVWDYVEYVTNRHGNYLPQESYSVYFQNGRVLDIQQSS